MSKSTRDQFNDVLRKQGLEVGIKPVQDVPNEESRLAEVERLGIVKKDFSADPNYNSITQLATILTGTQVGLINILGASSQLCKTNFGLNVAQSAMAEELPREISICQYSLYTPKEPLIINDLYLDERTRNFRKMEAYEKFRFYAGLPLVTSKGYSIGTLCVIGGEAKQIDHDQIEGLRILADQVVNLIESETSKKEAEATEKVSSTKMEENQVRYFSTASILFADFVGFTQLVESMEPGDLIKTLTVFFQGFDRLAAKHKVTKVKTIGDCYMCVSGIPGQEKEHAERLCGFAADMLQFVGAINVQHQVLEKPVWNLRVGIHSGPLIANLHPSCFDVWGDSVNVAARLESSGETGKIHISAKTADYLGEKVSLTPRGEITLKNKGAHKTFFVDRID